MGDKKSEIKVENEVQKKNESEHGIYEKTLNNNSGDHKNSTSITKPTNPQFEKKGEIRSVNPKKSGETILSQIYQHKKSLNLMKKEKEGKDLKLTTESQFNKIESLEYDIKEDELNNKNINHIMTQDEENQIRNSLKNHFVFKDITPDVLNLVINELKRNNSDDFIKRKEKNFEEKKLKKEIGEKNEIIKLKQKKRKKNRIKKTNRYKNNYYFHFFSQKLC